MTVLQMTQTLAPNSRTGRGSAWLAKATVEGVVCEARSRNGAPQALARHLVAAGVPDQPVEVTTETIKGATLYPSLHAMAKRTFEESATVPVRSTRYRPSPHNVDSGEGGKGQNEG